jgi:redox-sensing transcriptional repressor
MVVIDIPEVVVLRLPLYIRALTQLSDESINMVSSQQLGAHLQISPAQIRKDLNYFGRFGKQGHGYNVEFLLKELKDILCLDRQWTACLIGVGRLGRAIINYPGFNPESFKIVSAHDHDTGHIGQMIGDLIIQPMSELAQAIFSKEINIGIVAVPAVHAQEVVDCLVANEVSGILNYAPIVPKVPQNIVLRNIDPILSLQSMTFYLGKGDIGRV